MLQDAKGRQLSLIFLRLPNQKEFPDYFEVIKNPIDFEMISTRLKQSRYSSVEEVRFFFFFYIGPAHI